MANNDKHKYYFSMYIASMFSHIHILLHIRQFITPLWSICATNICKIDKGGFGTI